MKGKTGTGILPNYSAWYGVWKYSDCRDLKASSGEPSFDLKERGDGSGI